MRRAFSLLIVLAVSLFLAGCPSASTTPPKRAPRPVVAGTPYTVQKGDTLYSIARKHGVEWRDLLAANPNVNPLDLKAGRIITIPGGARPMPGIEQAPAAQKPTMNPGHPGPITAESQFQWPLKGKIISRFGAPVAAREGEANYGMDIQGSAGEIVNAAKSGRVNTFKSLPLLGQVVILEHSDGSSTMYGQLQDVLVTHGTWVRQGERIGTIGPKAQLHFRLWKGNRFVDPSPHLPR